MTAKKRGRGRPKGAPNKPKMKLITEKKELFKNSDAFEIFCQADLVAQENEDFAINGSMTYAQTNGAYKTYYNGCLMIESNQHCLRVKHLTK